MTFRHRAGYRFLPVWVAVAGVAVMAVAAWVLSVWLPSG